MFQALVKEYREYRDPSVFDDFMSGLSSNSDAAVYAKAVKELFPVLTYDHEGKYFYVKSGKGHTKEELERNRKIGLKCRELYSRGFTVEQMASRAGWSVHTLLKALSSVGMRTMATGNTGRNKFKKEFFDV